MTPRSALPFGLALIAIAFAGLVLFFAMADHLTEVVP
jgi:hypothetical protein